MDKQQRAEALATEILQYARNELLVSLRFMDLALCKLPYKAAEVETIATDGKSFYFRPGYVFRLYEAGGGELNYAYLHLILHCVFCHPFVDRSIQRPLWDLACDIAVAGIIFELDMKQLETLNRSAIGQELDALKAAYGSLTAERLYRKLRDAQLPEAELMRLQALFACDAHDVWYAEPESRQGSASSGASASAGNGGSPVDVSGMGTPVSGLGAGDGAAADIDGTGGLEAGGNMKMSPAHSEWQEISQRVKIDLETSSKSWGDRASNLMMNVTEVNREKYDYAEFLRKFAVLGEEMRVSEDEFDYIFYTYGLQLYKNVPLIEPLEYRETRKIKDFVIAIDTSGSVEGELVATFLNKTYNILLQQENFFTKINVHIIQCDAEIQEDVKITSYEEFQAFMENIRLRGFGGTDFRPVFRYVDELIRGKEFTNLKGLIYFTDGYGTFPEEKPGYDAAFVFIDDEYGQPEIPVWAIKLVLRKDEI